MANLEAIVSKKTENDTQWKARQQADRENLMALQDVGVLEITRQRRGVHPLSGAAR